MKKSKISIWISIFLFKDILMKYGKYKAHMYFMHTFDTHFIKEPNKT